ncbi:MAG: hypothetical protein WCL32_08775 [Planctomycetota bacterium]
MPFSAAAPRPRVWRAIIAASPKAVRRGWADVGVCVRLVAEEAGRRNDQATSMRLAIWDSSLIGRPFAFSPAIHVISGSGSAFNS